MTDEAGDPASRSENRDERERPQIDGDLAPLGRTLNARWLGRVSYEEALDLQHLIFDQRVAGNAPDYLLLLEHPDVYTLGRRARPENILASEDEIAASGASICAVDRGGDVTYHGPGQLVAYPIVRLSRLDVVAYVRALEEAAIETAAFFGVEACRVEGLTGVWVGDRKLCAIGVRVSRMTTMHGLALNVSTDLSRFEAIVPCGITERGVTSLERETGEKVPMDAVIPVLASAIAERLGETACDLAPKLAPSGVESISRLDLRSVPVSARSGTPEPSSVLKLEVQPPRRPRAADGSPRPEWMRVKADLSRSYRSVRSLVGGMELNTVCESAGCPNIYECWSQRTATFMILGDECTRACGFCKIGTARPKPPDEGEAERVAEAVATLGLEFAVITSVARDDLPDGGATQFARSIDAIHARTPECDVEVLVPDFKGDSAALAKVLAASPRVLNHNIETVPRLSRRVRPSASYARSLALLARARASHPEIITKSGLMVGLGETLDEVRESILDLASIGVGILTVGQYLQPTSGHLPVERWWSPEEFAEIRQIGTDAGIGVVESGPLVRSSYHARSSLQRPIDDTLPAFQLP